MPLQPWVQETVTSTMAEKARHRFQTPWSIHWELAEGPLQGALTPHQKLSLIRDHEAAMEKHLLHLHGLADNVRTCEKCNRRQIMTQVNQDCPSCLKPGFTVENQMSIGPSLTQEACLAVRVQRADLFNSLTQATYMEINLIRAVLPMMRTSRLVFQGTGQFSFKGHSIGTENNNGIVAMDLPRDPSNAGVLLICDSAENYRTDPELCRMYMARRDFVVHLFHLVMLFNLAYIAIYGERYEPPAANIANIPEMGISDKIPVVYEDRHCTIEVAFCIDGAWRRQYFCHQQISDWSIMRCCRRASIDLDSTRFCSRSRVQPGYHSCSA